VKQLITRLDDDLHASLKARAAAQRRSLNELVVETLAAAVAAPATKAGVRERARAAGMLVVPEPPSGAVAPADLRAGVAGTGKAVSSALHDDRSHG
jgi:plasmid stability protein